MDNSSHVLIIGGVACITGIKHPIEAARLVMDNLAIFLFQEE